MPSTFHERDLDPEPEEPIVGWSKILPNDTTLGLLVDLDRTAGMPGEATVLRDAIHEFGAGSLASRSRSDCPMRKIIPETSQPVLRSPDAMPLMVRRMA